MKIRVGVEGGRKSILAKCRELDASILVSANSLWDQKRQRFSGWQSYTGFDVALDSGGFIAMRAYGGYRWSIDQYVKLAEAMRPTWWAQMDFCCEPEIAGDKSTIHRRIDFTVEHLHECQRVASQLGAPPPMPVIQGWEPKDYCQGPIYDPGFAWPDIVGIGSVCRRPVLGPCGVMSVVDSLDRRVPRHVRFHLFGIKGTAIQRLTESFPNRIASMDSMAWNMEARWQTFHSGQPRHRERDAEIMAEWYRRQSSHAQPSQQLVML